MTIKSINWSKECDLMLVLGSSLQTHSSFRLVRKAHENNVPILIINIGETRADSLVNFDNNQNNNNVRIDYYVTKTLELINNQMVD